MADGPTEEEFAKWLTPQQALNCLPGAWDYATKVRWVDGRLKSNLIRSAASASRGKAERTATVALATIPPVIWNQFACLAEHDFWTTGDVTFYSSTTGYDRQWSGTLHDVRFDPAGFDGMTTPLPAETLEENVQPAPKAERPNLSDTDLDAWAALFNKANPGASEAKARAAIEAMFPDKQVTRERLRRVLPARAPGRPLKNQDK
jgi:hypothetical protein